MTAKRSATSISAMSAWASGGAVSKQARIWGSLLGGGQAERCQPAGESLTRGGNCPVPQGGLLIAVKKGCPVPHGGPPFGKESSGESSRRLCSLIVSVRSVSFVEC